MSRAEIDRGLSKCRWSKGFSYGYVIPREEKRMNRYRFNVSKPRMKLYPGKKINLMGTTYILKSRFFTSELNEYLDKACWDFVDDGFEHEKEIYKLYEEVNE